MFLLLLLLKLFKFLFLLMLLGLYVFFLEVNALVLLADVQFIVLKFLREIKQHLHFLIFQNGIDIVFIGGQLVIQSLNGGLGNLQLINNLLKIDSKQLLYFLLLWRCALLLPPGIHILNLLHLLNSHQLGLRLHRRHVLLIRPEQRIS